MKFATRRTANRDGELLIVSRDLSRAASAAGIAPTLLDALERWQTVAPQLKARYEALNDGHAPGQFAFDPHACTAPLPRGPQWCDASAFLNHGRLMERAFNMPPIPDFDTIPVVYQGASDDFLARIPGSALRGNCVEIFQTHMLLAITDCGLQQRILGADDYHRHG